MISKPNIILIVLDTVRVDRLSCYGHFRKTTPRIDKIAKEGALFKNAFSTASWTLPSHASIFTGKYPSHHKVLGSNIYLDKGNTTIAEILSKNGYRTLSVAGCRILVSINGFDKGFHECIEIFEPNPFQKVYKIPIINRKAALKYPRDTIRTLIYGSDKYVYRTNEYVKKWVKENYLKKGRTNPFFLFINYFGCHSPHVPPKPFGEWFCRFLDYSKLDFQKLRFIASDDGMYNFIFKLIQASHIEWEVIKTWYDAQLFYLDHYVGELVDFLKDKKICDDTLLIITSDHGENFGEHGLALHKFCVYDTLLHVPLIMRYPSSVPENKTTSNLVSTIDIFPTILDASNIGKPDDIQGESLYPFDSRQIHKFVCAEHGQEQDFLLRTQRIPQHMLPELKKVDLGYKSIRDNRFKYIISSNGKEELYNIGHDPFELKNISSTNPEKTKHLKSTLEKTIDIQYFGEIPEKKKIDGEVLERLKALGYL
jgi:arylsulfatase A-like enzyme